MKNPFNTYKFKTAFKVLYVLGLTLSILLSSSCQDKEAVYFPDIVISSSSANCSLSSISRNNQLIAVVYNSGEIQDGYVKWNLLVSKTNKIDWFPLFSDDHRPTFYIDSAFSPDATMLAATDQHGSLWIFDTSRWSIIREFHYPWIAGNIVWSPDSRKIAVIGSEKIAVSLLMLDGSYRPLLNYSDIFPGKDQISRYDHLEWWNLTWSPDGKQIAYFSHTTARDEILESQLWTLDISSNQREMLYRGKVGGGLSWSPDGQKIVIGSESVIQVYDFKSKKLDTIFTVKGPIGTNRANLSEGPWSPDSKRIGFSVFSAGGSEDGTESGIYVIELSTMKVGFMPEQNVYVYRWSNNNNLVVSNNTAKATTIKILPFMSE
jgi:dipeptidyl aminopeptidase/acylaminoacyl peptidase